MNRSIAGRWILMWTSVCLAVACGESMHGGASIPSGAATADVAIENVTVIDAARGQRASQRVLIEDDRIVSVTSMSEPKAQARETIDASELFLIPGLWDMHVHFLYEPALTDRMASEFLHYGITSVRDTGGDLVEMAALLDRFEASPEPEPRLFFSGPLLDGRFVVYDGADPGRPPLGTPVPGVARAKAKLHELKTAGARFIKIYELVSPEVFSALVAEAKRLDLPIAAHVPLAMTADVAGPQTDSMEHLRNIELACASSWQRLLAERRGRIDRFTEGRGYDLRRSLHSEQRIPAIEAYDEPRCNRVIDSLVDTIQVPTLRLNTSRILPSLDREDWRDAAARLPSSIASSWLEDAEERRAAAESEDPRFAEWSLFLVSRLEERGIPIGAGTDTPIGLGLPGYSLHTELELLVEAGLSKREALKAATTLPARFFGLEGEMGRIEPGMVADLVLLEASPLDDIRNTRRISRVMSRGRWVPREADD